MRSPKALPSLDQAIVIERKSVTPDGQGGGVEAWATAYSLSAKVEPIGGREIVAAEMRHGRQQYYVTIRQIDAPDLTPVDRVNWDGQYLQILAAPRVGRDHFVTLLCEAGAAQ
jgi:head-tail adaptor